MYSNSLNTQIGEEKDENKNPSATIKILIVE